MIGEPRSSQERQLRTVTASPFAITSAEVAREATAGAGSLVDALPYIDVGYDDDPDTRQQVFSLIEGESSLKLRLPVSPLVLSDPEETKRYKPTKNYLDGVLPPAPAVTPYETELCRSEMARIASGKRMELLSMKRYELPAPPPNRLTDVTAWAEAVDNSYSQLEHQVGYVDPFSSSSTHAFSLHLIRS